VNWEAVAAAGQVIGAGGIIATLIFLARQISQNTKAVRISVAHSIATDARDWNKPLLADAGLALVFQTGTEDPNSLDQKERARFIELCFSLLRMFENAHYQFQHGTLDQGALGRLQAFVHRVCKVARLSGILEGTSPNVPSGISGVHRPARATRD
jgi:hypothetical protein